VFRVWLEALLMNRLGWGLRRIYQKSAHFVSVLRNGVASLEW
jgi:hypothetical protein